jgi:hypothetical protein
VGVIPSTAVGFLDACHSSREFGSCSSLLNALDSLTWSPITEIQNLSFVGCSGSSGCSFQASVMSSKTGLASEDLNQTKRMCMTTYEYALSHVSSEPGQSSQPGWLGSPQGLDSSEVKDGLNPNQVSSPTQPLLLQLSHWADERIGVVAMALAV